MRKTTFIASMVLSLLLPVASVVAIDRVSDFKGDRTTIAADEVVSGNAYEFGEIVTVNGTVDGDLFVIASTASITGEVKGDVIFLGERVAITGTVSGNVRGFAETLDLDGVIAGNATVLAEKLSIGPDASIGRNLDFLAQNARIDGVVAREVHGGFSEAKIAGVIGENVWYKGILSLADGAVVKGNVVTFGIEPDISSGATVEGTVEVRMSEVEEQTFFERHHVWQRVIWLFGMIVVGLVFAFFAPKALREMADDVKQHPGRQMGIGIAALAATPVLAIILAVTTIGIPLAVILGVTYGVLIYFGKAVGGIILGVWLVQQYKKGSKGKASMVLATIVGIIVLRAVGLVPYVGGVAGFLAVITGMGALLSFKARALKQWQE